MWNEEYQESTGDWASRLEKGSLTGKDLYALLDDVMLDQNKQNPQTRPAKVSEKFWDPTAVYLRWQHGAINMDRSESPDESEPFSLIHVEVFKGGKGSSEDFELRKYPDGTVKAFWYREPASSNILDEEFDNGLTEVPLTLDRIKRIGQVMISAHARTMAEVNSR